MYKILLLTICAEHPNIPPLRLHFPPGGLTNEVSMRCAVCDDNRDSVSELFEYAKSSFSVVDFFDRLELFKDALLHGKQYDVVFMDVHWDGKPSGLDAAAPLERTLIVYISACPDDCVERMFTDGGRPFAFLRKPVARTSFDAVLAKINSETVRRKSGISITSNGRHTFLRFSEIMYAEGRLHRSKLVLKNGSSYISQNSLRMLEDYLPPNFAKCHKSFAVNLDYLREVSRKEAVLRNGTVLPVSRSCSEELRIRFLNHDPGTQKD